MPQFFDYPLNYGAIKSGTNRGDSRSSSIAVVDNNYETYEEAANPGNQVDITLNIGPDGTADSSDTNNFTHIFIKGFGIRYYQFSGATAYDSDNRVDTGFDLGATRRDIPTVVTANRNDSGNRVDPVINNIQHDLYDHRSTRNSARINGSRLTLQVMPIQGQQIKIYEVMILNQLLNIAGNDPDILTKIEYDSLQLGTLQPNIKSQLSYVPPLGNERDKWIVNYTVHSVRRRTTATNGFYTLGAELINLIRTKKHFTFAAEPTRYPDRIFPAVWPNPVTQIRYLSRGKGFGRSIAFSVREA